MKLGDIVKIGETHAGRRQYSAVVGLLAEIVFLYRNDRDVHVRIIKPTVGYQSGTWYVHIEDCLPVGGTNKELSKFYLSKEG